MLTPEEIAAVKKHRRDYAAIQAELGLKSVLEARQVAQRVALHLL